MKLAALLFLIAVTLAAQGPPAPVHSPEVHPDHRVTFRLRAPQASLVELTGEVVRGSKTEPSKFEEYWTFARPAGSGPWQLSAINQV